MYQQTEQSPVSKKSIRKVERRSASLNTNDVVQRSIFRIFFWGKPDSEERLEPSHLTVGYQIPSFYLLLPPVLHPTPLDSKALHSQTLSVHICLLPGIKGTEITSISGTSAQTRCSTTILRGHKESLHERRTQPGHPPFPVPERLTP